MSEKNKAEEVESLLLIEETQAETKAPEVIKQEDEKQGENIQPINNGESKNEKEFSSQHEWFEPGQKVKVRPEHYPEAFMYETTVRDFTETNVYFDIPDNEGKLIVPEMNTKIIGNFTRNNNVYFFETPIKSLTRLNHIPVWILDMPGEFTRIQRRGFLRMDVFLPVQIRVQVKPDIFSAPINTHCLDISGGGIRYVLDFPLEIGKITKLTCRDFPGVGYFEILCKAVRCIKSPYSADKYWIGAELLDLSTKVQDKIVRYIFQIQKRIVINNASD